MSFEVKIREEAKKLLVGWDRVILVKNIKKNTMSLVPSTVLLNSVYDEILCVFHQDDFYSKIEQHVNYMNCHGVYHPNYSGERSQELVNQMILDWGAGIPKKFVTYDRSGNIVLVEE